MLISHQLVQFFLFNISPQPTAQHALQLVHCTNCGDCATVSSASPTAQQIWDSVQVGSLGFLAWRFLRSYIFLPWPWAVGIDAETNCHSANTNVVNVLEVVAMVLVAAQNGLPILQRLFSKEADEWAERRDHVGLACT